VGFYGELFDLIRRFCGDAADLVEGWETTTSPPSDPALRAMLDHTLGLIDSADVARQQVVPRLASDDGSP
jgi:hypothetical protein